MTITLDGNIYRVESCVKVTVAKGNPFIKTKLKNLMSDETVEKNFKLGQPISEVALAERKLEYLYLEGKDYLFLDVGNLEQVLVPAGVIGDRVNYLKEGIDVKAMCYGASIFSVELPQFLRTHGRQDGDLGSGFSPCQCHKSSCFRNGCENRCPSLRRNRGYRESRHSHK